MKKIIALLLTALLGLSVFAGGQQGDQTQDQERMEISIGFWDISSKIDKDQKDDYTKFIEDKFNVKIVSRNFTWGDFNEKVLLWGASGDLPDIFASDMMLKDVYFQWIEEGLLRAIPEDLSAYPTLQNIVEQDSVKNLAVDGKIYLFPRLNGMDSTYNSAERGILSRKDWREKLGIAKPETFEEYLALARAFVEMDPDGNGVDDTIGMTFVNKNYTSMALLSSVPEAASKTWKMEDGQWIPGYASKDMVKGIMDLNTLWTEGVMDPDTLSLTGIQGNERFAEGKTGMLFTHAKAGKVYGLSQSWDKYNDSNLADVVEFLPIWKNDKGERYAFHEGKNFWSSSYFSSSVSDEKMERIMAIYEFLLSEEGLNSLKFGIPGVDFSMNGNAVERINDEDMNDKYPSLNIFWSLPAWSGEFTNWIKDDYSLSIYSEEIMDMCIDQYEYSKDILSPVNMGIQYLNTPMKAKFERGDSIFDSLIVAFVSDDPVGKWNDQMAQLKAEGLETAIQEVNQKAAELGIR